jgi:VWFA-related protein
MQMGGRINQITILKAWDVGRMNRLMIFCEGLSMLTISRLKLLTLLENLAVIIFTLQVGFAQHTDSRPSKDLSQDVLKIPIEEVRVPVFASDDRGRFDTQLSVDDLLIREDGLAQNLRGVYRVPAYVLLLADTGGEVNLLKSVRLTTDVAVQLISELRPEDAIAVMEVNNKVELISDWSRDRSETIHAIRTKLLPGKRSALAEGLTQAVENLQKMPAGNRHLVIISDGLDERFNLEQIIKDTTASGVAVHVISYTSLTGKANTVPVSRPREKSAVPQELILAMPHTHDPRDPTVYDMKDILQAKGGVTVDVDRLFRHSEVKKEVAQRELEFGQLAEETGGVAWLPETARQMISEAAEAAHDIDSQYVVTYKPQRPLAEAKPGEYRKLDVISRRVGLRVRSRRGYVVVR